MIVIQLRFTQTLSKIYAKWGIFTLKIQSRLPIPTMASNHITCLNWPSAVAVAVIPLHPTLSWRTITTRSRLQWHQSVDRLAASLRWVIHRFFSSFSLLRYLWKRKPQHLKIQGKGALQSAYVLSSHTFQLITLIREDWLTNCYVLSLRLE